jgi:4-diphosphocytidyl-2-C-methyl-D-erythritol kinase
MLSFPNIKINLGLNIIEKRPDGFHNLMSVFYPVKSVFDVLEIVKDDENQPTGELFDAVTISGKAIQPTDINYTTYGKIKLAITGLDIPGDSADNLLVRAYNLINADYDLAPVKVHLHKVIPTGAGLGGGSADAAFFINALNEVLEIGLAWGEKHHYAKQLGSDCSFFITNRPAFCFERGDQFESVLLDLSDWDIVLVKPPVHVSTADAYAGITPKTAAESPEDIVALPVAEWKDKLVNDFEETVFAKYPEIAAIKSELYSMGATYACMSGSGATVFALFENAPDLSDKFANCFVHTSKL